MISTLSKIFISFSSSFHNRVSFKGHSFMMSKNKGEGGDKMLVNFAMFIDDILTVTLFSRGVFSLMLYDGDKGRTKASHKGRLE